MPGPVIAGLTSSPSATASSSFTSRPSLASKRSAQSGMFTHTHVTDTGLENMKRHKSFGGDDSITLKLFLKPYVYQNVINLVPMWVAPNLITLTGFMFVMVGYSMLTYYMPDLVGVAPAWVYVVCGLCVLLYQTLDNIDGRQARRTGTSSPLGELFDHGVDALATSFISMNVLALVQSGATMFTLVFLASVYIQFFLATYEEYHVGGLYLGWFNGPIEGLLMTAGLFFVAAIAGPEIYHVTVDSFLPIDGLPSWIADQTLSNFILGFICFFGFFICVGNLRKVYTALAERQQSFVVALYDVAPLVVHVTFLFLWAHMSPSHIYESHSREYLLCFGITFGYLGSNLTLSHLSKHQYRRWYFVHLPFACAILNAVFGNLYGYTLIDEVTILHSIFGFVLFTYGCYVREVINRITEFLGIDCLRIPHKG